MAPINRAAYLTAKQSPEYVVKDAPYTPPSTNELVIQTKAVAINPADIICQKQGVLIEEYPTILGCDVAGEVVEVDSSLSDTYKVGDRVLGAPRCLKRKDGVSCYSGFQEYVVLQAPCIAKIPASMSYEDATVLPLGITTAASCLFPSETLGLQLPQTPRQKQGKSIIIWGASSSVGSCGVQLAVQAGYDVIGVASTRNHAMVTGLGATKCFDQTSASLVDDVVEYLKGKDVEGAFDAVSSDSTLHMLCDILDKSCARKMLASIMPGSEAKAIKGVTIKSNLTAGDIFASHVASHVWSWLNDALKDGRMQCMPKAEVVGKGLEDLQGAVDLLAEGVSAKKLVVTL